MIIPEWVKKSGKSALKVLFPSHHRKVTNTVIAIGAALVLDGYFLNGIFSWLAQVVAAKLTDAATPSWSDANTEIGIWAGVILICMSLVYSCVVYFMELTSEKSARVHAEVTKANEAFEKQQILQRDRAIYDEVLQEIGTNTRLEDFLSNHNFGSSWRYDLNRKLDDFVNKWSAPERQFQYPEIRSEFSSMRTTMLELIQHVGWKGGFLTANDNLYCILDPSIHNDFDMPEEVSNAIDKANDLSLLAAKQRQIFIEAAERNFATLPNHAISEA